MSVLVKSCRASKYNASSRGWGISAVVLLLICGAAGPALAAYGSTDFPTVTSIYVFQAESGSVYQTGGPAGVSESYPIEGEFWFYVSSNLDYAYFVNVDARLTRSSGILYSESLSSLFNMTGLQSYVAGSTSIEFTGTTYVDSHCVVSLTLHFCGVTVSLCGRSTPPSEGGPYYRYEVSATAVRKYGGGTGQRDNPFLISTAKHMNTIGLHPEDWDKHFKLANDIDLRQYEGTDFNVIGYYRSESDKKSFTGTFNGNNRAISGFTYSAENAERVGLFEYIEGAQTQIANLRIVDPNIDVVNGRCIGALVGHLMGGTIVNCQVSGGSIAGAEMVGGLVGRNGICLPMMGVVDRPCDAGTLTDCLSTSNVTGLTDVGGLVGSNDGAITRCRAGGTVTGDRAIGGLVGANADNLTDCNSVATVLGTMKVGGMVGSNWGSLCGCRSQATVSGQENVGGLVGDNSGGSIVACHSASAVDGRSLVGGLAGLNGGRINHSGSAGTVAGDLYVGGLVGKNAWRLCGCYSAADVSAELGYAGGLVGINEANGNIMNCYATGAVTGGVRIGGLLGSNDGVAMRCYATGAVQGAGYVGGLVGRGTDEACALFCFWDTKTSGQAVSADGTGKATVEMQAAGTFQNWGACSSEAIWTIDNGNDYPRLLWEDRPGQKIAVTRLADRLAGSGSEDDPYLVSTPDDLNAIGLYPCEWDKHFKLMANLNLSAFAGTKFNRIGVYRIPFSGAFDGNGKTISNFTYGPAGHAYAGLFGCVGSLTAWVHDLGLTGANVDGGTRDYVGALAGCLREGTIENCYVENSNVSGRDSVAGIVGYNDLGVVEDCHATGTVNGNSSVGGLAGGNWNGVLTNCHAISTVTGRSSVGGLVGDNDGAILGGYSTCSVSGGNLVGGLVGLNLGGVENAYSTGQAAGNDKVGGLAGGNQGELATCYSTGDVTADTGAGGLAGANLAGTIVSCHATGTVYARLSAGGLVGHNISQSVVNKSYATGSVSGHEWIGGLVGRNDGSISTSRASGDVVGTMNIGGLVGLNFGQAAISDCYARGGALGYEWVGGLVGANGSSITNCYSSGSVTGAKGTTGGLVGFSYGSVLTSFWDTQTSRQSASAGGTGKTTAQMKTKATFTTVKWDFTGETANGVKDLWKILEAQDYPQLSWE